jgi:hypothetical protein
MKDNGVEESGKELSELSSTELKVIKEATVLAAKEAATGEYLVCLFLLMAEDERYGPLKTQLDNNFLIGEQEYSSNVLAANWMMTDFVPTTGAMKHKHKETDLTNLAFSETKDIHKG